MAKKPNSYNGNNGLQKVGGLEKRIGVSDGMVDASVADVINEFGKYVCQILHSTTGELTAIGTGFLVGRNRVLTNFHVVQGIKPENLYCRFDVRQRGPDNFTSGPPIPIEKIIAKSPYSEIEANGYSRISTVHPKEYELDYALLEIQDHPKKRNWLNLNTDQPQFHPQSKVYVLQHPQKQPLSVASDAIADHQPPNPARFRYLTDTESGSSGSPCFCWTEEHDRGRSSLVLTALHNFGDPGTKFRGPEFNHGIPIYLIARDLEKEGKLYLPKQQKSLLQRVLETGDNFHVLQIIEEDAEIALQRDRFDKDARSALRHIKTRYHLLNKDFRNFDNGSLALRRRPVSKFAVIAAIILFFSVLAGVYYLKVQRIDDVVPESGSTFSKIGKGWATGAYISKEIENSTLGFQNSKLIDLGEPIILDNLDIALYDVDPNSLDIDPPKTGQDVELIGFPINNSTPKSYSGSVLFQSDDKETWTVVMDKDEILPMGMAGGIVREEKTKTKLGIMLYHSDSTDIDLDGSLDYSYSFVAFSDVYSYLNSPGYSSVVESEDQVSSSNTLSQIIPYDPNFVGDIRVSLPALTSRNVAGDILNGRVFDYVHYSLVMDERRAMPLYIAYNIDRDHLVNVQRRDAWVIDERVPRDLQRGEGIYSQNDWDRGHLASRSALAWGSDEEALKASNAAFFYTNSVPQYKFFNRSNWSALERYVKEGYQPESSQISVFTGPVHRSDDFEYRGSRIPRSFWKIVIANDPDNSRNILVSAYLMDQYGLDDQDRLIPVPALRNFDPEKYQVSVAELERLTPLRFGILKDYDIAE